MSLTEALRRVTWALILLWSAPCAMAGAWPREAGTGFASTSLRLAWPSDLTDPAMRDAPFGYAALYLEYGLSDRVTLELDLGKSHDGGTKALVGFRMPLRDRDTGPKISAGLDLGRIGEAMVFRPSVSLGWGLSSGWFSIDMMAELDMATDAALWKSDVTWGRSLARDRKLIAQLQLVAPPGADPVARAETSLVFPLRERLKIEAGTSFGLAGDETMGLKLGLWTSF